MDSWFNTLREENLKWWELTKKRGWAKGIRASIVDKYPDPLHCLFELIQNAEDQNARHVRLLVTQTELVFTHDGEAFSQSDVERITGIGISEKESNKIGRFGIGFKSVFVISDFPEIYADLRHDGVAKPVRFGFGIRDLVVPERVEPNPAFYKEGRTTFRFELKAAQREQTVAKLQDKLPDLGADILLFLRKIEEMRWETPIGKRTFSCPRSMKDDERAFVRKVRLRSEIEKQGEKPAVRNFNYLLFSRRIEEVATDREVFVKIAFLLDGKGEISRDPRSGFLNVYFPTEERTFVGFRMHGPYLLTDNRANVKLEDPFNERLI